MGKTIFEAAMENNMSRRDFVKMCTALTAVVGLDFSQSGQVVNALEKAERVPVVWLQFQDCTGCSESFIRSTHPTAEKVLFDFISLEYTEVLSAASGHQLEEARLDVLKNYKGKYILAVEGSLPESYKYLTVGGQSCIDVFKEMAENAAAIVAYGSCSSWGGIAAAHPNPTRAKSIDEFTNKPVIKAPGCPPIAEVITGVIAHIVTFGSVPELDHFGRPKAFYRHRIHDKCNRRAYFDAGLFVEEFDDEGSRQGYCLYKVGCKGPTTYNSCAEMRWNGGVSYPIQSGNPCIGCSEKGFWDNGPFYERLSKIPATQTTINPDKVGLAVAGVTVAGIAVHAGATVATRKKQDKEDDK